VSRTKTVLHEITYALALLAIAILGYAVGTAAFDVIAGWMR